MGFKKPKKHRRLKDRLQSGTRRQVRNSVLFFILLFGGVVWLLGRIGREGIPAGPASASPRPAAAPTAVFEPPRVWAAAEELFEKARGNEYRGRKQEVAADYTRALELYDQLRRRAPGFRSREVQVRIDFCRGKLRKL